MLFTRSVISISILLGSLSVGAQREERRQEVAKESEQITSVAGGSAFQTATAYEDTFQLVLNYLKRNGETIETANKDAGEIATALTVKGGWHQTGTRMQVTLIRESATTTTVRVAATEQKRFKAIQTEPWGSPKVNAAKSAEYAEKLQKALSAAKT